MLSASRLSALTRLFSSAVFRELAKKGRSPLFRRLLDQADLPGHCATVGEAFDSAFGTMLSKRDAQFGRGRPVAPDTFIRGSDPKAHPHYYCDLAALATLFAGFELLSLTQQEQRRPGSWHWHILAERR